MKEFLSLVSILIGQLDQQRRYDDKTLQEMKVVYENMSETEQQECLTILSDALSEEKEFPFFLLSTLLIELRDVKIVPCIEKLFEDEEISLWRRISNMYQLRITMFQYSLLETGANAYQREKQAYTKILNDIRQKMGVTYTYIPYKDRKKTVVIVVSQLLGIEHAPTRKVISISNYLSQLGYDVKVYVCFYWSEKERIDWYGAWEVNNFMYESGSYTYRICDTEIVGNNLVLNASDYWLKLRDSVGRIWDEAPEWVLELGDKTLIGDLCRDFTSVVTMGCVKAVPVTNAPIIARYFTYSEEEEEQYRECVAGGQVIMDVKHVDDIDLGSSKSITFKKSDFGIPEECFTVIVAGSRLDTEVSNTFIKIIYEILEKNNQIVIAFIGDCIDLQSRIEERYMERIFFLGNSEHFKETIAIGDVFLNPPRQGGGTGGLFAIMEQVPVITLDHCDVEASSGKEFVCSSIEEMPQLVERYYLDHDFMEKQKQNCLINAKRLLEVDNVENFRKLCEKIEEWTLRREKNEK